ncbi:hypothetical protein COCCU_04280 [Corynebacterium occultum]|uniref:Uncharacterized protein n=1 Tax=Corynebacterium occultum TaxID=2675219 RepID=A0A6B8VZX9_9CORY|nr:hypothetical protein [Corynebacterium occultum]QGU06804.1 hypothetical protein COCCU_04280 [Corynebacterium occultum]
MGFLDRILGRNQGPLHIVPPADLPVTEVELLQVHTAEQLVILTTSINGARAIIDAARNAVPKQLRCKEARPVSLIPQNHSRSSPTLDPKLGWLIPISPGTAAELLKIDRPGEYELEHLNLALVVQKMPEDQD